VAAKPRTALAEVPADQAPDGQPTAVPAITGTTR